MAKVYVDHSIIRMLYANLGVLKYCFDSSVMRGICSKKKRIKNKKLSGAVNSLLVTYLRDEQSKFNRVKKALEGE